MRTRLQKLSDIQFPTWTIPLVLALLLILALGLFIPGLGFYQDDWHPIFFSSSYGNSSLWALYTADGRPFSTWPYLVAIPTLGFTPIFWHILLLVERILTVGFLWLTLYLVWPKNLRQVTWAMLLFSIYPLFKLQPLAVAYSQHWTAFVLYALSMLCMILAYRYRRWFWPLTIFALILEAVHLFTIEYFTGLELMRPVLLWILVAEAAPKPWPRLKKVLRIWLPYAGVLAAFTIWRTFIFQPGVSRNSPKILRDLLTTPIHTSISVLVTALQDYISVLFTPWSEVIVPGIFNLVTPANILIFFISIGVIVFLFFYLTRMPDSSPIEGTSNSQLWARQALGVGLAGVAAGLIPAWSVGISLTSRNPLWNSRLGMASMLGAALIIVGLLELLIQNPKYRLAIFAILVGLSVGWHLRLTNDYRWSWTKQSRFYQQLYWRAPYIDQPTTILSDGEIFTYMGFYPTSFAINTLYPQNIAKPEVGYWFTGLYKYFSDSLPDLLQGDKLRYEQYTAEFEANSLESLVILYEPERGQCLWVLRPEDQDLPGLPGITRDALALSDVSRIHSDSPLARPPNQAIFHTAPEPTWCYYFLKADLARQDKDYAGITSLWESAQQAQVSPQSGVELLPFIEGFARTGDWDTAVQLTGRATELTNGLSNTLCRTWVTLLNTTPDTPDKSDASTQADNILGCQ
jgi:hypothetical protein